MSELKELVADCQCIQLYEKSVDYRQHIISEFSLCFLVLLPPTAIFLYSPQPNGFCSIVCFVFFLFILSFHAPNHVSPSAFDLAPLFICA